MSFIEARHLSKVYGTGENAFYALNDVSFGIDKGSFIAITGASGSGKSTLLHMLGAIDRPTEGKVILNGVDVFEQAENDLAHIRSSLVGFIFQSFNLVPVLTVQENIVLPLKLAKAKVNTRYLYELMDMLGILDKKNHLPNQLSGGQQQRVAIARALITKPAIILADEPTGNLDSKNTEEVMRLLKQAVKTYKQTLILITHDASIAKQADGILVMRDGKVRRG